MGTATNSRSHQGYRLKLITDLLRERKIFGHPRDHVIIVQGHQLLDVSGVYEVKATLPDPLQEGNHAWIRGNASDGTEVVVAVLIIEDHVKSTIDGKEVDCVMVKDEPRTKEWLVPRSDLSPLPLTMRPMALHKRDLDDYLGDGWSNVFWNAKLKRRRSRPMTRILGKMN